MPNHITNYVHLTPGGERTRSLVFGPSDQNEEFGVDFNAVLPEPEELAQTQSPPKIVETQQEVDDMIALRTKLLADKPGLAGMGSVPAISVAEAERRMEVYGALDWYNWRLSHWGVKWNAYRTHVYEDSDDGLFIEFETPWGPPTPIFEAWEEAGITVRAISFDEDWGAPEFRFGDTESSEWLKDRRVDELREREELTAQWEEEEKARQNT